MQRLQSVSKSATVHSNVGLTHTLVSTLALRDDVARTRSSSVSSPDADFAPRGPLLSLPTLPDPILDQKTLLTPLKDSGTESTAGLPVNGARLTPRFRSPPSVSLNALALADVSLSRELM